MLGLVVAIGTAYVAYVHSNWKIAMAVFVVGYGAFVLYGWIRSGNVSKDPLFGLSASTGNMDTPWMRRYRMEARLAALIIPAAVGYLVYHVLS